VPPVLARYRRLGRPIAVGLTIAFLVMAVVIGSITLGTTIRLDKVGVDLDIVRAHAQRWLDTGSMYQPYQLTGPYSAFDWPSIDVIPALYPPPAVFLFLPFLWLPAVVWWIVPVGAVVLMVARWRPAPWTWPLMTLALAVPASTILVWTGGTTMWIAAFTALGFQYGGPGVLVFLKPSLAPFALAGSRQRSWGIALGLWILLGLVMFAAWQDYLTATGNSDVELFYSILSVPYMLIPVVAWLGRRRTTEPGPPPLVTPSPS
jgi:hypothetical protein